VRNLWPDGMPSLVARLKLRGENSDLFLYLSDWTREKRCWLKYIAREDGVGGLRYIQNRCGFLPLGDPASDAVLDLLQDGPEASAPTRITVGTVDSTVDELRLTFLDCGSRSYALDGPTIPSKPSRRVFLLDQGGCEWEKAEAVRDGEVVDEDVDYGAGFQD